MGRNSWLVTAPPSWAACVLLHLVLNAHSSISVSTITTSQQQIEQPRQPHALASTGAASMTGMQAQSSGLTSAASCKRVLWFTTMSTKFTNTITMQQKNMILAATMSARANAPSLQPHLLYDGAPNRFTQLYEKLGGIIHYHNMTFYPVFEDAVRKGVRNTVWLAYYGAYLRFDVPVVVKDYKFPADVESSHVLYTDTDVLFLKDINSCSIEPARTLRLGPENGRGAKVNIGVMYINLAAFGADLNRLIEHGNSNSYQWKGLSQALILDFYPEAELDLLPDRFNWKCYWGHSDDMAILHFHGPKPGRCLECLVVFDNSQEASQHCKAACRDPIYLRIYEMACAADGGQLYRTMVLQFYQYAVRALMEGLELMPDTLS